MSNFLANAFTAIAKALGQVSSIEADAEHVLVGVATGVADYEAGQAVVLGTISEDGHAGKIVAVMDGGAASKSLNLS